MVVPTDGETEDEFRVSIMDLRSQSDGHARVQWLEMHRSVGFADGRAHRWGGGQVKCAAARITQENRQAMLSGDKQRVEEGSLREEQACHEATLRGETDRAQRAENGQGGVYWKLGGTPGPLGN